MVTPQLSCITHDAPGGCEMSVKSSGGGLCQEIFDLGGVWPCASAGVPGEQTAFCEHQSCQDAEAHAALHSPHFTQTGSKPGRISLSRDLEGPSLQLSTLRFKVSRGKAKVYFLVATPTSNICLKISPNAPERTGSTPSTVEMRGVLRWPEQVTVFHPNIYLKVVTAVLTLQKPGIFMRKSGSPKSVIRDPSQVISHRQVQASRSKVVTLSATVNQHGRHETW
ncbi:hypothetical protein Bbelb_097360 [Branchiostoma belcheri]|nr:hypothetical protein Bbelb_097360 [Branchiostoma belcheri]